MALCTPESPAFPRQCHVPLAPMRPRLSSDWLAMITGPGSWPLIGWRPSDSQWHNHFCQTPLSFANKSLEMKSFGEDWNNIVLKGRNCRYYYKIRYQILQIFIPSRFHNFDFTFDYNLVYLLSNTFLENSYENSFRFYNLCITPVYIIYVLARDGFIE